MFRDRTVLLLSALLLVFGAASCKRNRPPDVPAAPAGPAYCFRDTTYTFSAVATDPDGDSVAVRFDWGDSTLSDWKGWYAGGDTITATHAWSDTGQHEVRVWAQDRKYHESIRSAALTVPVVLCRPPDAPRVPLGPTLGDEDSTYTFGTTAFHPDYSGVSIRFAWGDGDTSDWSAYVATNWPVKVGHVWPTPAEYSVTAQAKDQLGALSLWSDSASITVRPIDSLTKWRLLLATGKDIELFSSPAIGPDGTIYVGSSDSGLYAVNPDGTLRWRYQTGSSILSSPAVGADGTIYVGSDDGNLYALDPNGGLLWNHAAGSIQSSPAIATDGTIYFGSDDGSLYAVSPSGGLKWCYHTNAKVKSSPALAADGTIYFGSNDVYALNPDSTLKWRYRTGTIDYSSPAIGSDGTVYIGSRDDRLYALNPDSTLRWRYRTNREIVSTPVIAPDGTIIFGSVDGDLRALNPDSTLKWSYPVGGHLSSSPAVNSLGMVFFGSENDNFYILSAEGTLIWQRLLGDDIISSPAISPDGTIYFTCCDGYLYALKGLSPLADSPWPKFHHDIRNTGRMGGGR